MSAKLSPTIAFASDAAANQLVAGIPAAARALRNAAYAGIEGSVRIAVPGGWVPSETCLYEAARLTPDARWTADNIAGAEGAMISGADLQRAALVPPPGREDAASPFRSGASALRHEARAIIAETRKPSDGIVSRYINRPISQTISSIFLRFPGARPWHATLATALIGIVMAASLFLNLDEGLLIGAILFQVASVVDGVDGEIARATFRTSAGGAMLDSMTDALTNLAFFAGVAWNLFANGAVEAASAGAVGFSLLAIGKILLAREARRSGSDFTFDALKTKMTEKPSRIRQWLTWMTMRDFYALAACIAILIGAAKGLMFAFAIVTAGWFAVLCMLLLLRGPVQS